jgi:hypothetical protein
MADDKSQHEPSMEEILASIRRIIAEDNEAPEGGAEGKGGASESPVAAAHEDVLELTEVVEEEQAVANPPEVPAQNGAEPEFILGAEPDEEPEASAEDRLISAASAAASVASLSQLVARPRDRSAELPLGETNRTLEDMVRELLRPLLKTWLDENLPTLVERLVHEEIARLVREAEAR